jgi:hypothetical protein
VIDYVGTVCLKGTTTRLGPRLGSLYIQASVVLSLSHGASKRFAVGIKS